MFKMKSFAHLDHWNQGKGGFEEEEEDEEEKEEEGNGDEQKVKEEVPLFTRRVEGKFWKEQV